MGSGVAAIARCAAFVLSLFWTELSGSGRFCFQWMNKFFNAGVTVNKA